jgi:hypothetical protein
LLRRRERARERSERERERDEGELGRKRERRECAIERGERERENINTAERVAEAMWVALAAAACIPKCCL